MYRSHRLCGRADTGKDQAVDPMVACEDGHGSDGGEKLSLTAPQKQETYQSEPGDQGEERMTPQSTEGKSVVHQETTFGKRIPDGDRPAAVVTPASEEKPADHRDLMDQGQGVAAEGAVAFAGDQRHMAADPIFCSPEIGADDASEGGRAEKKGPKGGYVHRDSPGYNQFVFYHRDG